MRWIDCAITGMEAATATEASEDQELTSIESNSATSFSLETNEQTALGHGDKSIQPLEKRKI
jgi:hypothetical protein